MISKKEYGQINGQKVYLYTLANNKLEVGICDYGATIISIKVLSKNIDVVLGYDKLEGYFDNDAYFGCVVAPNANRIAKGYALIDGQEYHLDINNGPNNLHTHALLGFNKMLMQPVIGDDEITFTTVFEDGRANLPGQRQFSVNYKLNDDQLEISYKMISDKKTIFNPTQHSYFNLDGHNSGTILNHLLKLNCSYTTPVDESLIPTGQFKDVRGTAFDFREFKTIGQDIHVNDQQLIYGNGYDHNFVIDNYDGSIKEVAILKSEQSGIELHVLTDSVGIQIYTGNYVKSDEGKDGAKYSQNQGVALETQFYPDCINHSNFPSSIIEANKETSYHTIFKFI